MRPPPKLGPANQVDNQTPCPKGIGATVRLFAMGHSTCLPAVLPAMSVSLGWVCKPRALSWDDSRSICCLSHLLGMHLCKEAV